MRVRFESLSVKCRLPSSPTNTQGWMNEIHSYDPETYHATLTHSVYVRLEGSVLRLSKPNRNISRRATHIEPKPDVTYVSQKIYDLSDSKVRWLLMYCVFVTRERKTQTSFCPVFSWGYVCSCWLGYSITSVTDSDINICFCLSVFLPIGHVQ